jgi:endonuclease III
VSRVARIRARLRDTYGTPVLAPHRAPVDELVLTVLSQSTNDRNRDVAFLRLRRRWPGEAAAAPAAEGGVPSPGAPPSASPRADASVLWEAVRDAPLQEVEDAIQPGGLHRQKSVRIKAILEAIGDPLSLDHLEDMAVPDAQAELVALPGVGRKTAACVLLFSFGMRDVPVDTHVSRVAGRLAILPATRNFIALHDEMLRITPRGAELELHVNLLRHGRRTCHAQRPACERCELRRLCPSRRDR